jgi:hypothetical protein
MDEAVKIPGLRQRIGIDAPWLAPLRPLARLTFQVMYRVDTEELDIRGFAKLMDSRPVLRMPVKQELMQPANLRNVEQFLAARLAASDEVAGGRVYDLHIAEVARAGGAAIVVTENRRHFASLLRYGMTVLTSAEFAPRLPRRR